MSAVGKGLKASNQQLEPSYSVGGKHVAPPASWWKARFLLRLVCKR